MRMARNPRLAQAPDPGAVLVDGESEPQGLTAPRSTVEVVCLGVADAALAALLGALEGSRTGPEQPLDREGAWRHETRDSGAQRHVTAIARRRVMHEELTDTLRHHLGVMRGAFRGLALGEDRERAAVPPRDQVPTSAVGAADHARDPANAGIACGTVEFLVIGPKVVDIEECQADLVGIALRQLPITSQQLLEVAPRAQSGETVFAHPRGQAPGRAVRLLQAIARVAVIADEMGELPGGAYRLNDGFVPEHRAVRTVISQQHPGCLALADGLGEARPRFLVAVGALKDSQVVAEKRRGGVAAHLLEGGVHEDHRAVRRRRIANHDSLGRTVDQAPPGLC